jgi:GT2 family glycosyltransferase
MMSDQSGSRDGGPTDPDHVAPARELSSEPVVSTEISPSLCGAFDGVHDGVAYGWAIDLVNLGIPIEIELWEDDRPLAAGVTEHAREDVISAGLPGESAGFRIELPISIRDGQTHVVIARLSHGGHPLGEPVEVKPALAEGGGGQNFGALHSNKISPASDAEIAEETFDERGYLRLNSDVADAVARGDMPSGYYHYLHIGRNEGRPLSGIPTDSRNQLVHLNAQEGDEFASDSEVLCACDVLLVCPSGGVMLVGWIDDTSSPLHLIRIQTASWRIVLNDACFLRTKRPDVETALGKPILHLFGFMAFLDTGAVLTASSSASVDIWLLSGKQIHLKLPVRMEGEVDLRNSLLGSLFSSQFNGNPHVERIVSLDAGFGDQIVSFNRAITKRLISNPYIEKFGRVGRRVRGSIIVALYGLSDYLFVQNALFSSLPGIEDYEFIYVSNSPELGEALMREARNSRIIYDINQSVLVLPGNAGFGAANNVAASFAKSDRILNVNPDVFPKDHDWAAKHLDIIDTFPQSATRLFGGALYYDDGSMMHAGMYFESDEHITNINGILTSRSMVRVEHYGKGAPPDSAGLLRTRPVPAVSGAFMSSERAWFEKLGGFTEDFVFGHYEDADLCLKSTQRGVPPWVHDLKLWHFEGKGSLRLPAHEGGSAVNRWLFSKRWSHVMRSGLFGPTVNHDLPWDQAQIASAFDDDESAEIESDS